MLIGLRLLTLLHSIQPILSAPERQLARAALAFYSQTLGEDRGLSRDHGGFI